MDLWSNKILEYLEEHKEYEGFSDKWLEIQDFYSYVERTWVGSVHIRGKGKSVNPPLFPISSWNKYQDVLEDKPLTNNSCEGDC
jgi:hypothetical protein